jgi:hypothetical protein
LTQYKQAAELLEAARMGTQAVFAYLDSSHDGLLERAAADRRARYDPS